MALQLVYPGSTQPLGQYFFNAPSGFNRDTGLKGGEVGVFQEQAVDQYPGSPGYDESLGGGEAVETVITLTHNNQSTSPYYRQYLLDDGDAGYGTLFGSSFGATGTASRYVHSWDGNSRTQWGPNTQAGSHKITAWSEGIFATDFYVSTGLDPESPPVPGTLLYADWNGSTSKLTTASASNVAVGYFVEFLSDRSLVSTSLDNVAVGGASTDPVPLLVVHFIGMHNALVA